MKHWFQIAAKLTGLYLCYSAVQHGCNALLLIVPALMDAQSQIRQHLPIAANNLLLGLLYAGIGWALLFRTTAISDFLDIPEESPDEAPARTDLWLRFGIMLTGFFLLVTAVPATIGLLGSAAALAVQSQGQTTGHFLYDAAAEAIITVLATILTLNPDKVVRLIASRQRDTSTDLSDIDQDH